MSNFEWAFDVGISMKGSLHLGINIETEDLHKKDFGFWVSVNLIVVHFRFGRVPTQTDSI